MDVLERTNWLNVCLRHHTHTNCSILFLILFDIWHVFALGSVFLFFLSRRNKNIHIHFTWSTWHWIISQSPIVPCRLSSLKTFSLSERSMKYNLWPSPPIRVKHEKSLPLQAESVELGIKYSSAAFR